MRKAIFFDRNGTLNDFKLGEYITKADELVLLKDAARAVKKANAAGYLCIVVTNQGGVIHNKGITYSDVELINERLIELLENEGAKIDGLYFCPHYSEVESCDCRKPKTGMIDMAMRDFDINLQDSYMIGDSDSDILAGKNARIKTIGIGERIKVEANFCTCNVEDAMDYILKGEKNCPKLV
jgi:histidinol-phosphate phosphatase family domain/HAD-superfamily hydrolase, subfamily IIIA